jgi:ABC-type nickel/cobalt efflux system permease component RcnA
MQVTATLAVPPLSLPSRKILQGAALVLAVIAGLALSMPSHALDLVAFSGITGPMVSALTQLSALAPGVKALIGFVGFIVAVISLAALRNFGPVLFYLGMVIFAAVGLTVAGAIMGMPI